MKVMTWSKPLQFSSEENEREGPSLRRQGPSAGQAGQEFPLGAEAGPATPGDTA